MSTDRHAVYAISEQRAADGGKDHVAFRIGQPAEWGAAIDRHQRLDARRRTKGVTVRHDGRTYPIKALEVRSVDRHGRSEALTERHQRAATVPYRAIRVIG